ncbi:thioredoxin TrxA [Niveispirillum sp.]|uniref:thioredoxin TrxA n=1 Tax=Niveispirillum sp. TaxID=1917217 RepID=UPI001B737FB4|nr:thioredoxin TrxA [Niveispirillum sp.]MBP7339970.1 thioredoxin TrxA [Niveispirillum sp.]
MAEIINVTDASFEADVLKAEGPILLDFWAEWCGPCKMLAPSLTELAGELDGKLSIAKLNIDENPTAPSRYGVRGIPTLMIFKDGQVAATKIGALPKSQLKSWIEQSL